MSASRKFARGTGPIAAGGRGDACEKGCGEVAAGTCVAASPSLMRLTGACGAAVSGVFATGLSRFAESLARSARCCCKRKGNAGSSSAARCDASSPPTYSQISFIPLKARAHSSCLCPTLIMVANSSSVEPGAPVSEVGGGGMGVRNDPSARNHKCQGMVLLYNFHCTSLVLKHFPMHV